MDNNIDIDYLSGGFEADITHTSYHMRLLKALYSIVDTVDGRNPAPNWRTYLSTGAGSLPSTV